MPPVLSAQVGPRATNGSVTPELIVGVSQPLSTGGQRQAQGDVARREIVLVDATVEVERAEAALQAGLAWIDLALSDRVLALRQDAMVEAERLATLTETRVRLGESEALDLAIARGHWATFRASTIDAEGMHFAAAAELSLALGRESISLEPSGGLPEAPEPIPASETAEGASYRRFVAEKELIESKARLSRAGQAPTYAVGVQYQREGTGDQIFTGTFSVPLMPRLPGRFQETALRAEAEGRAEEARLALYRAKLLQKQAQHEEEHARVALQTLVELALPERKKALEIVRAKYELGSIDLTRVALHRQELLATEEGVAVALANLHRARLSRLRASGKLLQEAAR
jgi:outer membrane protein, heavy metal efflux system